MGAAGSLLEHSPSRKQLQQIQESKEEAQATSERDVPKDGARKPAPLEPQGSPQQHRNSGGKRLPPSREESDAPSSKLPEAASACYPPFLSTIPQLSTWRATEAAFLSTGLEGFVVGDIVRATLDGPIRYEGVVVDIDVQQETLRVDFGDTIESIPVEQCIKVLSWDHLEVGDQVQVRPDGMFQYFPGRVVKVNLDGTYKIQYEDSEDVEDNVKPSSIRKLATGRTMASRRWKAVIHAVRTTQTLAGLIRKKTHSESFDSSN